MAYEPLHHKYRPQTFGDLVGQETISLTLSNALEQSKIAPAYLFTGPRGTGKTSSARILAKSLNCLNSDRPTPHPCGKCEVCLAIAKGSALDVMEIDAASNTGVDNIREIIERSRFAPVQCRYKIYVVDECHMLSTAAFNALLKTLEEPPAQVVFILATTDPQRVLSTIISRCQRFDYRRIPLTEMTSHLRYIAEAEKIAIADDALTLVAQIANGGLRDAESLLDQLSLLPDTITVEKVWDLVGAVPEQDLLKLLQAIKNNDSIAVLQQCRSLLDRGREPLVVLQNLASFYLNLLIAKTAPQHAELTAVTEICWQQLCAEGKNWPTALILRGQQHLKEAETQLKRTTQPRLWLEVTLLGLLPEAHAAIAMPSQTIPSMSVNPVVTPVSPVVESTIPPAVPRETTPQAAMAIERDNVRQSTVPQPDSASTQQNKEKTHSDVAPQHFTNQPTAAANPTPTNAPNNYQDRVTNQEIWTKVVSCLQPPTTQALLKQQCHLVSFDGLSAIVGISSAKLQKLNQGKVPNIEAAFAQVCQRKVRVQLEVASSQGNTTKNSIATTARPVETTLSAPEQPPNPPPPSTKTVPPVENAAIAIKPPNFSSQNQATLTPVLQTPSTKSLDHNFNGSVIAPSSLENRPQVIATENSPVLTPPAVAADLTPAIKTEVIAENYVDSELQQAIASLTQSFEGEVVELDNFFDEYDEDDELPLDDISTLLEQRDLEEYDDEW
ncbi:MAG: DNA polymerase III subunit gamma/tau [Pleurocapsa minor HA4230-MV1]|jgi:DNA polymerase-3 subunit gamma/tau|nr:DNA polymerase III subunit gamma/tau [Pleurocapsa minor HA4230-MV1]